MAIYREGPDWRAVVVDGKGTPRPDLAARLTGEPIVPELIEVKKWTAQASWSKAIRRMADALPKGATPQAVAAFRVRRRS